MYLCGACTHPGGSVIGINGRNAAMAILEDSAKSPFFLRGTLPPT
jgi:phytoene dehydrogenase-like protein